MKTLVRLRGVPLFGCLLALWSAEVRADVCDENGDIEEPVSRILTLTATRLQANVPQVWTLTTAHAFAQTHLIRPPGAERLSEQSLARFENIFSLLSSHDIAQLEADLTEAGFYHAVAPGHKKFDYILLNGATAQAVRRRIHEFAKAVSSGALTLTPTTKIVFLDGERKLFSSETASVLLDPSPYEKDPTWVTPASLPTDERGMDEMLWMQMRLPDALRKQGILFVHAQKKPGAARAETADCVEAWVRAHHPGYGSALVVSNNPYIEYQRRVTEVLLEKSGAKGLRVAAMGPEAELERYDAATRLGLLLDALGATIFRANQQKELGLLRRPQPASLLQSKESSPLRN